MAPKKKKQQQSKAKSKTAKKAGGKRKRVEAESSSESGGDDEHQRQQQQQQEKEDVEKQQQEQQESASSSRHVAKRQRQHMNKISKRDMNRYVNKQRTLVFSSRGITNRDRHLMADLRDLLPHSKKDVKLDTKDKLFPVVNEVCEMKNCNNCIFFEARKHKDLYMWMARTPEGPSAKFLVQNVHTMNEVKLTGNCIKGSRPVLSFDSSFDTVPHLRLLKQMMIQIFGTPKGHPKSRPFVDHVFNFAYVDGRIFFRNYQIINKASAVNPGSTKHAAASSSAASDFDKNTPLALVEVGPRFVLNPVRIFSGSFGGATLYDNAQYVSPNQVRALLHKRRAQAQNSAAVHRREKQIRRAKNAKRKLTPLDKVFG